MLKKMPIYILLIATLILMVFQIYTLFYMMFYVQTTAIPGEEDVVLRSGDPTDNKLTFTCNVDWGEEIIPEMLAILKEKDVKITFFISGKWADNNPKLLREIYVSGHEIQSHGYSHKLCSQISVEEIKNEIQKTEDTILNLVGIETNVFAPPSGDYDADTLDVCREMGYTLSLWSTDTIDWREGSNASVITKRVLSKPLTGAIILMHPKNETIKALPGLIDRIQSQGIEIVPLHKICQ
jgi:peptidoglycan/xylan/chitin deacetylase (PgdA/CDA1 family)